VEAKLTLAAERHGLALALPEEVGLECAMAGPTGFEPAISSVTGWHVRPLHHGPAGATVAEHSTGVAGLQTGGLERRRRTSAAPAAA
jgi:hypothetical protein